MNGDDATGAHDAVQVGQHVPIVDIELFLRRVAHVALAVAVDVQVSEWRAVDGEVDRPLGDLGEHFDAIAVVDRVVLADSVIQTGDHADLSHAGIGARCAGL